MTARLNGRPPAARQPDSGIHTKPPHCRPRLDRGRQRLHRYRIPEELEFTEGMLDFPSRHRYTWLGRHGDGNVPDGTTTVSIDGNAAAFRLDPHPRQRRLSNRRNDQTSRRHPPVLVPGFAESTVGPASDGAARPRRPRPRTDEPRRRPLRTCRRRLVRSRPNGKVVDGPVVEHGEHLARPPGRPHQCGQPRHRWQPSPVSHGDRESGPSPRPRRSPTCVRQEGETGGGVPVTAGIADLAHRVPDGRPGATESRPSEPQRCRGNPAYRSRPHEVDRHVDQPGSPAAQPARSMRSATCPTSSGTRWDHRAAALSTLMSDDARDAIIERHGHQRSNPAALLTGSHHRLGHVSEPVGRPTGFGQGCGASINSTSSTWSAEPTGSRSIASACSAQRAITGRRRERRIDVERGHLQHRGVTTVHDSHAWFE